MSADSVRMKIWHVVYNVKCIVSKSVFFFRPGLT